MKNLKVSYMTLSFFLAALSFTGFSEAQSPRQQVVELLRETEKMIERGEYASARQNCEDVLAISGELFPAYNYLGRIELELENDEEAISYFRKSLEIQPEQPALYQRLHVLYRDNDMMEKAIDVLKEGIEFFPKDFTLNYALALMFLVERHDSEKALEYFKQAESSGEGDANFKYVMGFCLVQTGRKEEALEQVTELRQEKHEVLARRLEDLIRTPKEEEQEQLIPPREIPTGRPAPRFPTGEKGPRIFQPEGARTTIRGQGELEIRRSIRPRED